MNQPPLTVRHPLAVAAPRIAPALATTALLVLGRVWNANGAEHSLGNAVLMTVLATAAAAAGVCSVLGRAGDGVLAGFAFATSGGLALAGVAGYADGLSLPLLLWAVATAVAYALAVRHWRAERRASTAFERRMTEKREDHGHAERIEAMRSRTRIEVAREGGAYALALAEAMTARATLPGYDPVVLGRAGLPRLPEGPGGRTGEED
ncbi:hypothetical protein NPS70_18465 [Streptomyces sp. C10-9-1]|uniref:hypothetical protein n=1 Tax=Streptomyces sp. C10-9-1 TaxID=1859285 RepID=UPI0021119954|nr:hypothetical protein [Streptomyces sp. C10-9-1]MCQ6555160.1 hypothetical protein [Streptomyces sp. C10-9-1]